MHTGYFIVVQRIITALLLLVVAFAIDAGAGQGGRDVQPDEILPMSFATTLLPAATLPQGQYSQVVVTAETKLQLSQAFVLVNGEKAAALTDGQAAVQVAAGDIIGIDASAYQRQITFYIEASSPLMDPLYYAEEVSCCGDAVTVGVAVFR